MKLELDINSPQNSSVNNSGGNGFNSESGEVKEMLRSGIKLAKDGNRTDARQLLLRVTEVEPHNETAWLWLASISEYPEELLVFLQNVLNVNPTNERALEWAKATKSLLSKTFVQRGINASHENQKDFAKQCFLQAIVHDAENEMAWLWLASASDSIDEKMAHLQKVLDINPANETALSSLKAVKTQMAQALLKKANSAAVAGEREPAQRMLDEIMKQMPELEDAWILQAYLADGFYAKIACYEKVLALNPENEAAQAGLASLKAIMEKTPELKPEPAEQSEEVLNQWAFANENVAVAENEEPVPTLPEPLLAEIPEEKTPETILEPLAEFNQEPPVAAVQEEAEQVAEISQETSPEPAAQFSDVPTEENLTEHVEASNQPQESHLTEAALPENDSEDEPEKYLIDDTGFPNMALFASKDAADEQLIDDTVVPNAELDAADDDSDDFLIHDSGFPNLASAPQQNHIPYEAPSTSPVDNFYKREIPTQELEEATVEEAENLIQLGKTENTFEEPQPEPEGFFLQPPAEEEEEMFDLASELDERDLSNLPTQPDVEDEVFDQPENLFAPVQQAETTQPEAAQPSYNSSSEVVEATAPQDAPEAYQPPAEAYNPPAFSAQETVEEPVFVEDETIEEPVFAEDDKVLETQSFDFQDEVADQPVEETVQQESEDEELDRIRNYASLQFTPPVAAPVLIFNCPFCEAENEQQSIICHSCRSMLSLSDLEMMLAHHETNQDIILNAIERLEIEKDIRGFNIEELKSLAIAHLNAKNLRKGLSYLQEALQIEPNDVVLGSKVNFLAIRLSEIEAQEDKAMEHPVVAKTIMVVDDSPTVRKLITGKLEKCGHSVVVAVDGMDALAKINELVPDLILLDITMPRLDGYQVCKLIRNNDLTKDVPIVMISGKDGFFDKVRGRMAGSSGYITKPFGPDTLMKTIETYIN